MIETLDGYLSPAQAARVLNIAPVTVRWLVKSGKLPALRTPNGMLLRVADVEQAARERATTGREVTHVA